MKSKWTREDGERLRAWRERMGLRQQDVAARAGVSANTVSRWECGASAPVRLAPRRALRRLGAPLDHISPCMARQRGERLRAWLSAVDWTQDRLSVASGVSPAVISRLANDGAIGEVATRLLAACGVPMAIVLGGSDADALIKRARKIGPLPADRTPASKRAALRELATDAVATGDAGAVAAVAEALGIHAGRLRAAARADVRARHGVSMGVLIDEARQIREAHDASERRYNLKITDELLDVARAAVDHDDPTCLRKVASALGVYVGRVKYLARLEDAS